MSAFKQETLPSGLTITAVEGKSYDFNVKGEYGQWVKLTKSDINRMHGIAFPEKRRTGVCCNAPESTIETPAAESLEDSKEVRVSMTYAERIMACKKRIANAYNQDQFSMDQISEADLREAAVGEVEAQVKAIEHVLEFCFEQADGMEEWLIDNGYKRHP